VATPESYAQLITRLIEGLDDREVDALALALRSDALLSPEQEALLLRWKISSAQTSLRRTLARILAILAELAVAANEEGVHCVK
jgi:hypothetical protein